MISYEEEPEKKQPKKKTPKWGKNKAFDVEERYFVYFSEPKRCIEYTSAISCVEVNASMCSTELCCHNITKIFLYLQGWFRSNLHCSRTF